MTNNDDDMQRFDDMCLSYLWVPSSCRRKLCTIGCRAAISSEKTPQSYRKKPGAKAATSAQWFQWCWHPRRCSKPRFNRLKNRFADDRKQHNASESEAEASRENGTLSDDLIYLSSHLRAKDLLRSMWEWRKAEKGNMDRHTFSKLRRSNTMTIWVPDLCWNKIRGHIQT